MSRMMMTYSIEGINRMCCMMGSMMAMMAKGPAAR